MGETEISVERYYNWLAAVYVRGHAIEIGIPQLPKSLMHHLQSAYDGYRKEKKMGLKTRLLGHMRKTVRKENKEILPIHYNLGEDYYLAMNQKPNGFGGYADVNIGMYKADKLIRQITDETGRFLDFPGVEHGKWEDELRSPFQETVRFTVSYNRFQEDGTAEFFWTVQPDGRYWADDDGFGMEDDMEIVLCAKIDKTGRFVTPFSWRE